MVAAMATVTGPATGLAEISRMASESVESWLREYEGYRGLVVLTDEEAQTSRVITFWETPEAEASARAARGAMRDQIVATAGMEVVDFGVYEVPVYEVVGPGRDRPE
jgi:heme-degrading monooxygenase HmoA